MSMTLTMQSARIEQSEFYNNMHYTVVTMPAPDAFSHPSRFRLQSKAPLGAPGSVVTITVDVGGLVREKQYRDKISGQLKTFHEGVVFLNVVSSGPAQAVPEQKTKTA